MTDCPKTHSISLMRHVSAVACKISMEQRGADRYVHVVILIGLIASVTLGAVVA